MGSARAIWTTCTPPLSIKYVFPPLWKHHRVLFQVERHILALVVRFVVCWPFSFLFSLENYSLSLFVVGIQSILFLFFLLGYFYRSFICFQFYPLIPIYKILYFLIFVVLISRFFPLLFCKIIYWFLILSFNLNLVLILLISIFFLGTFVKVILLYNFTLQSKFCFLLLMSILLFILLIF